MNIYLVIVIALSILFFLLAIWLVSIVIRYEVIEVQNPLESVEPMRYQCDNCGKALTPEEVHTNIGYEPWLCDKCVAQHCPNGCGPLSYSSSGDGKICKVCGFMRDDEAEEQSRTGFRRR